MIEPMDAFEPRATLRSGHRMTLYGWGNPRYFPRLPAPSRRLFEVASDARVAADCHWHPRPWERATLVALHGLNGSSDAHYMRGLAAKAFASGLNVVRLNQRNCGSTEHLAAGLFHSGLTTDAARVIAELVNVDGLAAIAVVGYSLGGNLALKLAGEYGSHAPNALIGVAAVSPIIEIEECTRALERPENFLYEWNFVRDLKRRMTFIYTKCPLPTFCPLMDRHFASIQKTIASTPAIADVRLLTVTLDPDFDRPAILKAHARRREADPAIWTFLTGDPTEVNKFAAQFGLYVEHNPQDAVNITHNLRTAVIDPEGRLVTAHSGNSWTPAELVVDLSAAPAPAH